MRKLHGSLHGTNNNNDFNHVSNKGNEETHQSTYWIRLLLLFGHILWNRPREWKYRLKIWKKCSITEQITIRAVLVHLFDFNEDNHHRVCRIWCAALMSAYRSCRLHELYFLVFLDLAVSLWFLSHVESSIIPSMPPLDHLLVDVFRSSSNLPKWFFNWNNCAESSNSNVIG